MGISSWITTLLLLAFPAGAAQTTDPPGPWSIELRATGAVESNLPEGFQVVLENLSDQPIVGSMLVLEVHRSSADWWALSEPLRLELIELPAHGRTVRDAPMSQLQFCTREGRLLEFTTVRGALMGNKWSVRATLADMRARSARVESNSVEFTPKPRRR